MYDGGEGGQGLMILHAIGVSSLISHPYEAGMEHARLSLEQEGRGRGGKGRVEEDLYVL